jgi:uncharacterized protein YhbP (UPF0306 family)
MLEKKIIKFIKKNHVAAIAAQNDTGTWCFNAFYAFDEDDPHIIFLSTHDTLHADLMTQNPHVSGTISGQPKLVAAIQGIQFTGFAFPSEDKHLRTLYNKRFPFAIVINAPMWAIRIDKIKYTSNITTFGSKIYWERG